MNILVVYESVYGNTHAIADAIAGGAREAGAEVRVSTAEQAGTIGAGQDLLIVGGPTHMHGMASNLSRKGAVDSAHEDDHPLDPAASDETGLRTWIAGLDGSGARAVAFDTRIDKSAVLTGSASRGIAKRLGHRHFVVDDRESFLVDDSEGPPAEGELDRARAWGSALASG